MDIHKPHAAKTWREFFIELGTIVAGILIALGLEQAMEALRHRGDAHEARETIRAELTTNITRVQERAKGQACVDRRLDELKAVLDRAGPDGHIDRPKAIGEPSRYGIETSRWDAASDSGRISLLKAEEQGRLGFIYTALRYFYEMENGEQLVWARLHAMQGVDHLTPDGVLTLRSGLEEARFYNWSIRQVTSIVLDRAAVADIRPAERAYHQPTVCAPLMGPS